MKPSIRFNHHTAQGQFVFEPGLNSNVFQIAINWDLDKAGIYVAVSYIGLLDELALFNRPMAEPEINRLRELPGMLSPLKNR